MLNFTTSFGAVDTAPPSAPPSSPTPVAEPTSTTVMTEQVTYRRPETRTTDVGKPADQWNWEDLRNYVVRQIEAIHGPFPRDARKERAIFSSFLTRHGIFAAPIAQAAFEAFEGTWKGSPVSIYRFCKGSDEYFAIPIKERLTA